MAETIRTREKTALLIIFTTFMGQIYLQPFESDFRLTLAVVVINVAFLVFKEIRPMLTINLVGLLMLIVRSSVYAIERQITLLSGLNVYWPVLLFYFFYGLLFVVLEVRSATKQPLLLLITLWFCDSMPNILEFIVRRGWAIHPLGNAIYTIVAIGLIRSVLSTLFYYGLQYYVDIIKARRKHQDFVDNVVFRANLRTELFFLKKSRNDIEDAMQKSYKIYECMAEVQLKQQLLEVTRDIHEIKKDYSRVLSGIERHLSYGTDEEINPHEALTMKFSEILEIVVDANQKVADRQGKHITFETHSQWDGQVKSFYAMISTLNNLVINGIEAIESSGRISLSSALEGPEISIRITDSAGTLEGELEAVIFTPGYSTKYDPQSGIMSAGVGLSHVKQIVEEVFGGRIRYDVNPGTCTAFEIKVPMERMEA